MMVRTVVFLSALTIGTTCFTACQATGKAAPQTTEAVATDGSYVSRAAVIIQSEKSRDMRAKTAVRLTQWVRRNPAQVCDSDISTLTSLLRDDDDIIRGEAAGSLGFVGPRAISAAPALIQALRERPCTRQPAQSAGAMRVALERIGAEPVNVPCTDPFGSP